MKDENTAAIGFCRVAVFSTRKVWFAVNQLMLSQWIVAAQRTFR
jgi:hypothetical protein